MRVSLASALRFRKEYGEAQRLLDEAETICRQHEFEDMLSAIGSCRSKIERELQAAQAPSRTLPELLQSLGQLLAYRHESRSAYLPFWYFAMQSELLNALRSGPDLSLMVITDEVKRFMGLARALHHVARNFIMVTTIEPSVTIEPSLLAIPPTWEFPSTFTFMLTKNGVEMRPPMRAKRKISRMMRRCLGCDLSGRQRKCRSICRSNTNPTLRVKAT